MYRPRVDKSVGVFQEIINRFREQDKQRGLVHLPNKKTPYINVVNIVAAAHDDSFEKYLKEHGLPTPGITMTGDWRDHHDCVYLRTHGFLNQKGFGTLLKYIGIAQLADYIDHVPNREPEVNWRELTITDAILLFRRLCREVGVKPRNFGPFVHAICRATLGQRRNLALFGGRKLMAPPPWCRFKQQWDEVLAEERQKHYKQQARRQGRAADESEGLPAYGYRTAKNRAPRRKKRAAADEEQSSEHSSEQNPFDWPSGISTYLDSQLLTARSR